MQIVRLFGAFVVAVLMIFGADMMDESEVIESYGSFGTVIKAGMYGIAVTAVLTVALEITAIMTVSEPRKTKSASPPPQTYPPPRRAASRTASSGWTGYNAAGNPYASRQRRKPRRSDLLPPKNW